MRTTLAPHSLPQTVNSHFLRYHLRGYSMGPSFQPLFQNLSLDLYKCGTTNSAMTRSENTLSGALRSTYKMASHVLLLLAIDVVARKTASHCHKIPARNDWVVGYQINEDIYILTQLIPSRIRKRLTVYIMQRSVVDALD